MTLPDLDPQNGGGASGEQADALFREGYALHRQSRFAEARAHYEQALSVDPNHFQALHMLGVGELQAGRWEPAAARLGAALRVDPEQAAAHMNLGLALMQLQRYEAAIASYQQAIALDSNHGAEAYYRIGNALRDLRLQEAALESYDRTLACAPNNASALNSRGVVLHELDRYEAAVASYDHAIAARPDYAEAFYNRGISLADAGQLAAALASYDRAIELKPAYAPAHGNRGLVLVELGRLAEADASFVQAIQLDADTAEFHANLGHVRAELQEYEAAIASYDRALALQPHFPFVAGLRRHLLMRICDWRGLDADLSGLFAAIERGRSVAPPFVVLTLTDSAPLQQRAAQIWVDALPPAPRAIPGFGQRARPARIRIGYFSADFQNHATAHLLAGVLEKHDRSAFEVTAFSFGPDSKDPERARTMKACEHFIDVRGRSDREIAVLAREREIDVAVDLKGFTRGARPGIFANRAAPVQVSYLGYPGTMSASYIDYLIADLRLVPEPSRTYYSERLIYLPNSYQPNDAARTIADEAFSREELGLPRAGFVFCCFNSTYKILPATFDVWMRILARVPGSVLWLLADNQSAVRHLRHAAEARRVAADRLGFAPRMPPARHLARHRAADLFLDTLPCNAHTTASDALWSGLPVLTRLGQGFASRVAASLLAAIGLPELITDTEAEYEEKAVALARDPEQLGRLRTKLLDSRGTAALFDTGRYAKHLESAFLAIDARHRAGLPPDHVQVRLS